MAYEIIQINENTWRIEDNFHVRFFLLTGTEKAILIDCGMAVKNAKEIAQGITELPVALILTHADPDHIGSIDEFDDFYMSPAEAENLYEKRGKTGSFTVVNDGDMLDLGGRPLEIVTLPGHTPGSIGILDVNARAFFTGDPIQDGTIYMFGRQRNMAAYRESLKKADAMSHRFDCIYPSHGSIPVGKDIINKLYEASGEILEGKYVPADMNIRGTAVNCFDVGIAKYLMDK